MDLGFPALQRSAPLVLPKEAVYTKPLWERSAFRTWALAVGGFLISGLSGEMPWAAVGTSCAIASITAALSLFFGADSIGVDPPNPEPKP